MNVVAIIQARMSSSRLPEKVLLPLAGKPVIHNIVERLSFCKNLNNKIVATSLDPSDDPLFDYCTNIGITCFRGQLEDVLDRYYRAAKIYNADVVVRITGDCPVIDPIIVDAVICGFLSGKYDYYGLAGEFPDGLDCTAISFAALEQAWKKAKLISEREHVGPFIENNPQLFKTGGLVLFEGLEKERWTLDTIDDYEVLVAIFNELYDPDKPFLTHEILDFLNSNMEIKKKNSGIIRNEGYQKSLIKDGEKI